MQGTHIVERAFELARSGRLTSALDVVRELKTEGYENVDAHLSSASLRRQLTELIQADRTSPTQDI